MKVEMFIDDLIIKCETEEEIIKFQKVLDVKKGSDYIQCEVDTQVDDKNRVVGIRITRE